MPANGIRNASLSGDVFLSADVTVNDALIGPDNGAKVAWFLTFASNEVVFAYSAEGRYAADLVSAAAGDLAWHEIFSRPGFRLRRGDPDTDPLAYYILFVCQLAETHYGVPGLKSAILGEDRNPAQIAGGVPSPASAEVDAAFLYRNTAIDNGMPFIALPDAINLNNPGFADACAEATYTTSDTHQTFRGRPIAFSAAPLT